MRSSQIVGGEIRHHRRVRPVPARRPRRLPWFVALGVGGALLTGVLALTVGSFVFGSFSSVPLQSSAGGLPNAPPGVSFPLAEAQLVNGTTVPAVGACTTSNLGTLASPTRLTNGVATGLCLNTPAGGFASGDTMYILEISWSSAAANATIFRLQVSIAVTPAANDISVTSYINTSATISTSEQAIYALDLSQTSDTSITSFAVLVTQL